MLKKSQIDKGNKGEITSQTEFIPGFSGLDRE
jgi:hypothetical protein